MNILVLGSGGREHALCWKLRQSPKTGDLYCAPGNAGTASCAANWHLDIFDYEGIKRFCREKKVELVVIGPEAPLARGITDHLENAGIRVCGPSYAAARVESSKILAKEIMGRFDVPTAAFRIFDDTKKAKEYINKVGAPIVVKADGLAAGKGVIVAETVPEAIDAVILMLEKKEFGSAGRKIIIEECLRGEEVSILVASDGSNIIPLASCQDHKRIFDGDAGPNTGGMGAYSPTPLVDDTLFERIRQTIIQPVIDGLKEEGTPYKGVLYVGLMITDSGPKVLEFNARLGDPETQVILPRMKTDLADLLNGIVDGKLAGMKLEWQESDCVCVVLASGGYPGKYATGKEIYGIREAEETGAVVFHAGTLMHEGKLVTSGGRVLNVVASGSGIKDAIDRTYRAVEKIHFDGMQFRKDIGYRALQKISVKG